MHKKSTPNVDPAITNFPTPVKASSRNLSDEEKISEIAGHFKKIMEILELDLSDDSLTRTPERVAKMYVKEIFSGLDTKKFPTISVFDDHFKHDGKSNIVFVRVSFISFCEHHFIPMSGTAYIAYLPGKKLIGLSKIPRIVRYFSKRPQVQERLTAQIADSLSLCLDTNNVAVSITAQHFCVIARGIEDESGHTITNVFRGDFDSKESLRQEFFEALHRSEMCDINGIRG